MKTRKSDWKKAMEAVYDKELQRTVYKHKKPSAAPRSEATHTPTPLSLSFDGMGLNDANDEYKSRVATFTERYREQGDRIVRAVNSHDELVEMTRALVDRLDDGSVLKARAQEILAKAERVNASDTKGK